MRGVTGGAWVWGALGLLFMACAEREAPSEGAAVDEAPKSAAPASEPVDASPPDDAAAVDAAQPADAAPAPDAAAPGSSDAGARDGGSAIKIVAGAPVFEAEPDGKLEAAAVAAPESAPAAPEAVKPDPPKRAVRKRRKKVAPKAAPTSAPPPPSRRISPMQTIRSHYGDVHHCYARVALKDSTIAGRITLQWSIGPDGMPQAVAILNDTLKDKSVGQCLKAKARTWKFPATGGGVQVISYPFDLRVQ